MSGERKRIGIFGWGIVAPKSPNIESFERNLISAESWLEPFNGFGPDNFLVGNPSFDFNAYKPWIDQRFEPRKFAQLEGKMGNMVKYAIGAFIQSLQQNPNLEEELQKLGEQTHIYVGTGLGDLATSFRIGRDYFRAQRRWKRFWCQERNNPLLAEFRAADEDHKQRLRQQLGVPLDPAQLDKQDERYEEAVDGWLDFWVRKSPRLQEYLSRLRQIESEGIGEDIEKGKGSVIRRKAAARKRLNAEYGCPLEPWNAVDASLLWNIPNIPAAQISMLGRITGPTIAPIAACSGFGTALKLGVSAIQHGEAKAAVIGMTDPEPHPLTVGSFFAARVVSQDGQVSKPFTGMRGTHVSGGACIWVIGDADYFRGLGMKTVGLEILGVAVNSDADHIITPSQEGPRAVIQQSLQAAGVEPHEVATWDMHATATPGDWTELQNTLFVVPGVTRLTARKGSFGHGMSVCGGWELTAQHLGFARGILHPVNLAEEELHPKIRPHQKALLRHEAAELEGRVAGKLNMGVGGVNACVISRLWEPHKPEVEDSGGES
jgi:3-oxoacyl-[acyl-carrier-protein] synthase II